MTDLIDRELMTDFDDARTSIARAFEALTIEPNYKPNALTVFNKRYPRKDKFGEPTELPAEVHWRIALNVSSVTTLYTEGADWAEGDNEPSLVDITSLDFPFRTIARQYNWLSRKGRKLKEFRDLVYNGLDAWLERATLYYTELLAPLTFVPNSPTWTGAGTPLGQLAACFVLPIADSLVEGDSNIMQTLRDAVAIQKTGGGNGFSFGRLRPAKSIVGTSMGQSTGPVGFLKSYNSVFEEIRQGGSRRGANMGVLPIWHPDVIQFIISKVIEGEIANFNISVGITDRFMRAVQNDEAWEFHFPGPDGPIATVEWNGEQVTSIPARELWDFITVNAHKLGDPGALFLDAANRTNPTPYWYELESTNPCGEQWLGPYENCCLGSIAVQKFVKDGSFDWQHYARVIRLSTEFLDDVVDANAYVPSVPQLEEAAQGGRRIGLGQMGLADALIRMGVRYGRGDGLDFASQLTEFQAFHTMLASSNRSKERGSFERIEKSIYDADLIRELGWGSEYSGIRRDGSAFTGYLWDAPKPLVLHADSFGRPEVDWELVKEQLLLWGKRNSCDSTFAPTGTIATTAGVEGYGCEPIFALIYTRTVMQEAQNITLKYPSGLFAELLTAAGINEEGQFAIAALVETNNGSCQGINEVPEHIRDIMVVAADISGGGHIKMQAVLQRFVDNSISKTINFPKEATVADVAGVYLQAWELGCKGVTIYRQGSRELEVLATTTKAAETGLVEVVDVEHWPTIKPLPIPAEAEIDGMPSRTYTARTPFGKMRATITSLVDYPTRPFDVEVGIGRGGSDVNAFTEAIGRLVSLLFRAGVEPNEVADQLLGIGGSTQEMSLRPDKALSVPDALGKLLTRDLERRTAVPAEISSEPANPAEDELGLATAVVEKTHDAGTLCPDCKKATVYVSQGCKTCMPEVGGCGWSKC